MEKPKYVIKGSECLYETKTSAISVKKRIIPFEIDKIKSMSEISHTFFL